MDNYKSSRELINALKYNDLKEGEVVVKIDGEVWIGSTTEVEVNLQAGCLPTVKVVAYLKE